MNTSSEAPRASDILTMTTVTTRLYKAGAGMKRHLNVTMIDGAKYKIKCSEKICELLGRQEALKQSVVDVEKEIERHLQDLVPAQRNVENTRKSVADEDAKIEEARKELKACEKSLAAAEKEAKKRGKTVSKATEIAVEKAREHLEIISTCSKFGGIVFLRGCLEDNEKRYNEIKLAIDEKRDRIARMCAERESNKSQIQDFVIEYVAAHPKTGDEIDIDV